MRAFLVTACLLLVTRCSFAQEDDEDNPFRPGVIATYTQEKAMFARIEPAPALAWRGAPAMAPLTSGPVEVTWQGRLLTQGADNYRLHVYGIGDVKLELNGKVVLEGKTDQLAWTSSAVLKLEHDYQPLVIRYRGEDDEKRLRLFWSSDSFALEPIPAKQLFHEPEKGPPGVKLFERGRELARAHRCAACHEMPGEAEALKSPALDKLAGNINSSWLVAWLAQTHVHADKIWLPEAASIAAALLGDKEIPTVAVKLGDAARGRRTFETVGCLACHRLGDQGAVGAFDGSDLTHIADKRPADYFARWLASPSEINRDHRMPVFELSALERTDIATYLASLEEGPRGLVLGKPRVPDPDLGRELMAEHRCANCHRLGGKQEVAAKLPLPKSAECKQRSFVGLLKGSEREALTDYLKTVAQSPRSGERGYKELALDGRRLLAEKNCFACHVREDAAGLAPKLVALAKQNADLAPLVPALTPPSLVAVGDKLHDPVLLAMMRKMEQPHRDYLQVRMPRFDLSPEELDAMLGYFVSHDRIPPNPPDDRARPPQNLPKEKDLLEAGKKLVVAGTGLSCTSCHAIGKVQPSKAPINARGPNLANIGFRIREPFFYRWCKSPARIIPGQEMPSVSVAVKGVLKDNVDHQLAAVWTALNTPGFEPKDAAPLRVVRLSGDPKLKERAVIGTDVFKADGKTYIAPLVIGLPNRHNVLFDLETGRLARWWVGDMMEQRTQGKSWHWQTEEVDLLKAGFEEPEMILIRDGKELRPRKQGQFLVQLKSWTSIDHLGVAIRYRLEFVADGEVLPVDVSEHWTAERNGITRLITVDETAKLHNVRLRIASAAQTKIGTLSENRRTLTFGDERYLEITGRAHIDDNGLVEFLPFKNPGARFVEVEYALSGPGQPLAPLKTPSDVGVRASLTVVPGLRAVRLPLDVRIMPLGFAWVGDDLALVSSLDGRVWAVDGAIDSEVAKPLNYELAAPYGIAVTDELGAFDVVAKGGVFRLSLTGLTGGRVDHITVLSQGWGHTDDYHDWAVGLLPQKDGYLVALPCQQDSRSPEAAKHRGEILDVRLKLDKNRRVTEQKLTTLSSGHRFPMGLSRNRAGDIFVTDNQGNYNPFNELNHVQPGKHYGFINANDKKKEVPPLTPPAINIPHPWTRSVNGICFLDTPESAQAKKLWGPFEGHLVGCEYDTRRLIRMSLQKVGETYQGACYPFSLEKPQGENFLGPISCAISPRGELYIGSIRDSGWGGGANVGEIVRIAPPKDDDALPAGIAEVTASKAGFTIAFTQPVDGKLAAELASYTLESYTRVSTPAYGGEDKNRRAEKPASVTVSDDRRSVLLKLPEWRTGYVYELHVKNLADGEKQFFPAEAHYTLNVVPD